MKVFIIVDPDTPAESDRADVARFVAGARKPLPAVTLPDLQASANSLDGLSPASRYRNLRAVKSLLAFGL